MNHPTRGLTSTITALVLLVVGTMLGPAIAQAGPAGPSGDREWSGFPIAQSGAASGAWIGARKLERRVVYRVDPGAAREAGRRFGPARAVSRVAGPGPKRSAGVGATRRAAYILSKYGTPRIDVQSAAVDAAVLHLVAGGKYRLKRRGGLARLRQTGEARVVKRLASSLLGESGRFAGPYSVAVEQRGAAYPGGEATIQVTVTTTRTQRPLRSVPVQVLTEQGRIRAGRTSRSGTTLARFPTPDAGQHPITVIVGKVPESRLLLRTPLRKVASRVAVAGVKGKLVQPASVIVTSGRPRVSVEVDNSRVLVDNRPTGTYTVSGSVGDQPRTVRIERHGPADKGSQVNCRIGSSTRAYRTTDVTIRSNGTYPLPRWVVRQQGYYLYSVTIAANQANPKARTCGGKVHAVDR